MKWYEEFRPTRRSFRQRVGWPDVFSSAIGRVAMNFSELEDELSVGVTRLLGSDVTLGEIVTAELSFKNKVHLFSSLFRRTVHGRRAKDEANPVERLDEVVNLCFKAEELRNQVLHSSWVYSQGASRRRVHRRKVTAKAGRGLTVRVERVTSSYMLDIADYIAYAATMMQEFMLLVEHVQKTDSFSS